MGAGVTVTVRLAPLPLKTMLFVGTKVGFDEPLVRMRLSSAVSASATVNASAAVLVSSATVWSAIPEIVGGVFCAVTVSTNVSTLRLMPSLTPTVIVAVPVKLAAGVTVTVRLLPLPPNTMLFVGTNV